MRTIPGSQHQKPWGHALWIGLLGLGALLPLPRNGQAADSEGPAVRPLRNAPLGQRDLPTTSARIFAGNLDKEVHLLEDLVRHHPEMIEARRDLSALYHARGLWRGDLDEIQRGIDQLGECLQRTPGDGSLWLARAGQQLSLHRFRDARLDLERAKALGVDPAAAAAVEQELDWSAGSTETAIASIRTAAARRPNPETIARLARLEHDLGNFEAADRAFETAEDLIVDPNPIPVAWLNVQRGRHKLEIGDAESALLFFSEALARMPDDAAARESLAEALHALGRDAEAIAQYETILQQSSQSDVSADLALLYQAAGRLDEAAALAARARDTFEALLVRYPEAMYWHAAQFFLNRGDRERALELLTLNLGLRADSTAWSARARVLYELGRFEAAKQDVDRALAMPVVSADLYWTASLIYAAVDDQARSEAFVRRARDCNPQIARKRARQPG
jgi:tetratricopeptide (TPR) repeat protein